MQFIVNLRNRLCSEYDPREFSISITENLVVVRCGNSRMAGYAWKFREAVMRKGYGFGVYFGRQIFGFRPPEGKNNDPTDL
jgi:hypothetical protein